MEKVAVAIIGAGPYGLSALAYLRQTPGLDIKLFGEAMSFWECHMPPGMLLRSPWVASHIADPEERLTLDVYRAVSGSHHLTYPVPVRDFIGYGHWFHQQVGLAADRHAVREVEPVFPGFRLTLDDGDSLHAKRVVVAAGLQSFVHRPKVFDGLPAALVTHTSDPHDFVKFRHKEVLVIGAGQSALEAAAFFAEAGASVEVLTRAGVVHWIGLHRRWMHATAIRWMFYGRADVGPAGISLVVQRPNLFRRLPRSIQTSWGKRAIRPGVSERLSSHARNIPIHTERFVIRARAQGDRLRLHLNDGTERLVDHVVLGTGYRVNVARYPFLSPRLVERLELREGYPRLDAGFETSLPGLHFLGAPAAWSFGPLMRFVAGTEFASRALTRAIRQAIVGGVGVRPAEPGTERLSRYAANR